MMPVLPNPATESYMMAQDLQNYIAVAKKEEKQQAASDFFRAHDLEIAPEDITLMEGNIPVFKSDPGTSYSAEYLAELKKEVSDQLELFKLESPLPKYVAKEHKKEKSYSNPLLQKGISSYYSKEKGWNGKEPNPWTVKGAWNSFGFVNFIGQRIDNSTDIAQLFSIYRNPKLEYFHIVLLKEKKIVRQLACSSGMSGAVRAIPKAGVEAIEKMIADVEYDSVYLIHNHPSGEVEPSRADVFTTQKYIDGLFGEKFTGHIILDHSEYALFKTVPGLTPGSIGANVSTIPYTAHQIPDDTVLNDQEVNSSGFAASVYRDHHNRGAVAINLNNSSQVLSIDKIDLREYDPAKFIDEMLSSYTRDRIIVTDNPDDITTFLEKTREFGREQPILDFLYVTPGTSNYYSLRSEDYYEAYNWQTAIIKNDDGLPKWNFSVADFPQQGYLFEEAGIDYSAQSTSMEERLRDYGFKPESYNQHNTERLISILKQLTPSMAKEPEINDLETFYTDYELAKRELAQRGLSNRSLRSIGFEPTKEEGFNPLGYFGTEDRDEAVNFIKEEIASFKDHYAEQHPEFVNQNTPESWDTIDALPISELEEWTRELDSSGIYREEVRRLSRLIEYSPQRVKTIGDFDYFWSKEAARLPKEDEKLTTMEGAIEKEVTETEQTDLSKAIDALDLLDRCSQKNSRLVTLDKFPARNGEVHVCGITIKSGDGRTLFDMPIKPGVKLPPNYAEKHGLDREQIEKASTFKDAFKWLKQYLKEAPVIMFPSHADYFAFNRELYRIQSDMRVEKDDMHKQLKEHSCSCTKALTAIANEIQKFREPTVIRFINGFREGFGNRHDSMEQMERIRKVAKEHIAELQNEYDRVWQYRNERSNGRPKKQDKNNPRDDSFWKPAEPFSEEYRKMSSKERKIEQKLRQLYPQNILPVSMWHKPTSVTIVQQPKVSVAEVEAVKKELWKQLDGRHKTKADRMAPEGDKTRTRTKSKRR